MVSAIADLLVICHQQEAQLFAEKLRNAQCTPKSQKITDQIESQSCLPESNTLSNHSPKHTNWDLNLNHNLGLPISEKRANFCWSKLRCFHFSSENQSSKNHPICMSHEYVTDFIEWWRLLKKSPNFIFSLLFSCVILPRQLQCTVNFPFELFMWLCDVVCHVWLISYATSVMFNAKLDEEILSYLQYRFEVRGPKIIGHYVTHKEDTYWKKWNTVE